MEWAFGRFRDGLALSLGRYHWSCRYMSEWTAQRVSPLLKDGVMKKIFRIELSNPETTSPYKTYFWPLPISQIEQTLMFCKRK